jgi:hypothetical protein
MPARRRDHLQRIGTRSDTERRRTLRALEKLENNIAAVALQYFVDNFIRIHRTLKVTPAMVAGGTPKLWKVSDLVALLETAESKRAFF